MSNPLITFSVGAYNHERFIREAFAGALAQTYVPLQIIVSDDCSTDRTFAIVQEMAATYQGPHKVLLNRNEKNMGLAAHASKVLKMCEGELIVMASGDDVSLPNRVERLYQTWVEKGCGAVSIYSSAIQIDERGNPFKTSYDYDKPCHPSSLAEVLRLETSHVVGATQAISRVLWDKFGGMLDGCHEDEILPFRALLMDGIHFIPDRLMLYRTHHNNFWNTRAIFTPQESLKRLEWMYRNKVAMRKQWLADYRKQTPHGSKLEPEFEKLIKVAEHQLLVIQRSFFQAAWRIGLHALKTGSLRGANILMYKTRLQWRASFAR